MIFLRQVWALTVKNLLITIVRPWFTTPLRALLLPVVFIAFISYAKNLFIPPSKYGVADATPVRSFVDSLNSAPGGRDKIVFVNNGFTEGDIDRVIAKVAQPARANGKKVDILSSTEQLQDSCRSTLRGTSPCIVAAVFFSSPREGYGGIWNYSIRADRALGTKIDVTSSKNDAQILILPFQHAVDWAIASVTGSSNTAQLPEKVMEYSYTSMTEAERKEQIRIRYMGVIVDILGVAIFLGMVGVTYQLTGLIASERELGISQLIDCMMPNKARWQPQAARLISAHLALDIIYAPGWIIMAAILKTGVFTNTSVWILIGFHFLTGLSLSSFSLFGGSFFKKSQLSGIAAVISCLLLGIISQMVVVRSNAAVIMLSLFFPPMNYVYFTILIARWETQDLATDLVKAAPQNPWTTPGIVLWILLILQIIVYPMLGAYVERVLYGTASKGRKRTTSEADNFPAVSITGFTKVYRPNWFYRNVAPIFGSRRQTVLAVNNLNLNVVKGEIMILLGANGSGKSTTLDAISGLSKITSGEITVNDSGEAGGFGLCPQRNVLWDLLTVKEHIRIFNLLKAGRVTDSNEQIMDLIKACDLERKINSPSKTLSGGQKRKLQMAMMFTGGSTVCCVDEVSSGLDPISRRKVWDILLAERGVRSILLTTHFLDEAELLADHIAILSKGVLKVEGTTVELKHQLGSGYRIHVYHVPGCEKPTLPHFEGIPYQTHYDETTYTVSDSSLAAEFVVKLEEQGIKEYRVSGPTIEDVFLKVAEEIQPGPISLDGDEEATEVKEEMDKKSPPQLLPGRRIGMKHQAWILFCKRAIILRRNYLPYLVAFLLPVVAAGLVTLFLKDFKRPGCSGPDTVREAKIHSLFSDTDIELVVGPASKLSLSSLRLLASSLGVPASSGMNSTFLMDKIRMVETLQEFNGYIERRFHKVMPGGFFLGDGSSPLIFAWRGNGDISFATSVQNTMDTILTNITIGNQYQALSIPWAADSGKSLQLITYFGLALAVYPAFFALYPTIERLKNVRGLHYSNGVRSLPLWLAYAAFDFLIVLTVSIVVIGVFVGASGAWYHAEYLFVVLLLYGLASILLSYVVSTFSRSSLAAFAFAAGGQAVMFLIYFIAYMSMLTYAPTNRVDSFVNIAHFVIAALSPIGNVQRSMFTSLNMFSILCDDKEVISYPGKITLYGGPILYLILQSFLLLGLLLWCDNRPLFRKLRGQCKPEDTEEIMNTDADIKQELTRVSSATDGLQVLHLNKSFGKSVAVQDITFGVSRSQVFALLGPNGAGKSTTISLIRGDIQPSRKGGEIFVENVSVLKQRATARSYLGVCPQFDAMDQMTVIEHLRFYARIRGVSDVEHNVREVIRAVGLTAYSHCMGGQLSGGNKRKLSLGIALMGNPTVLLLDEPSSGMDAASKRVMWRTLASVVPGRSLVLTTHSMEEADALANRAGILAKKMLALGTTDYLRRKYGNMYHVHFVHADAPRTDDATMDRIRTWVIETFPGAVIEQKTYHGQMRFSVSAASSTNTCPDTEKISHHFGHGKLSRQCSTADSSSGIGNLFTLLERNKQKFGFQYYSISQTTLDQVFLSIVEKHHVEEEEEGG
ncbi:uncharacterized protein PADG_07464 [Paracoccidioides brasiliensis Pb18]|uniref:ABC transporter domain-containing protein n=1 Tax=Paracoccidioides brasiliensis (strain Pb18) TaxID=502780 RepID=C1GJM8_PARBD|nr:uncharacterized protein PADG_07464 [Paracoccidioides brasiliensis Pb18]EEH42644.2 hypothetical protein PADG_07464 [Paracoccidioides brasiliensis Pb18]